MNTSHVTPPTSSFGWAIVGPGRIAHRFAEAVHGLPGMHLAVVQGRDPGRVQAFADHWTRDGRPPVPATTDLAAALARPDVDGVYIATPHAFHGGATRDALLAGKAVLCEKPLVPCRAEALPLVGLARERGVFLMEAVWTRFLPIYATVKAWLVEGAIGPLQGLQSSFCFDSPYEPASRLYDPALAGGALLDLGVYNLTMTRWVLQQALGECPEPVALQTSGRLAPSGVDQRVWATLDFGAGRVSQFTCGFDGSADNGLRIFGQRGHIVVPRVFWEATEAQLHIDGEAPVVVQAPLAINGFEGEIDEVVRCASAGRIESAVMPHADTLATLGWMDRIRAQLGVRYPFE
ncbi:MAG TPA: Gfo/Idh/MocA family oxidoreductase [Ideonella sp.]|uniref:Gfo/Idh/MocA family protein n=1 Tax=Ideonella sp. TaxID=1929293 RepID=UPI002E328B84|nr:Gfo/Idh/MocA family oxidoreductase [Ideonella sp.]HEX5686411.1 Gfo/Idh/MocA family oxidoreductase [Ideonella sp.]